MFVNSVAVCSMLRALLKYSRLHLLRRHDEFTVFKSGHVIKRWICTTSTDLKFKHTKDDDDICVPGKDSSIFK